MLQVHWYHNSVRAWLIAALIAAAVFVGLVLVRRVIIRRVSGVAGRTRNAIDDMALGIVRQTRSWVLLVFALYTGAQHLDLATIGPFLLSAAKLALLWQAGVWSSAAVSFWVKQYIEARTASNQGASVTMIRAMGIGASAILWTLIAVMALKSVFAIEITPLITGLGVGGIAVALAVQNILGDLLAALAIVFDRPFDVGDYISVDDIGGTVEQIGLKTTRLRSLDGEQIVLGNGDLLKSRLHNYRRMYQRRVAFTLDVALDTPLDVLRRLPGIVETIVAAQSPVKFDRSHVAGMGESAIRIETVFHVLDPDYTIYMDIQQAITFEILRRFGEERVRLGIPARLVYHEGPVPVAGTGERPQTPDVAS